MKQNINLQSIFVYTVMLFWGIPFLQDVLPAQDAKEIIWTFLIFVNPVCSFVFSYWYSYIKKELNWYIPLGICCIFLPLPFLFYPLQHLIYLPLYGVCSIIGLLIGKWIASKKAS